MRVAVVERDRPGGVCLNWGTLFAFRDGRLSGEVDGSAAASVGHDVRRIRQSRRTNVPHATLSR